MRSLIFYICGFCFSAILPALADELPANPWLRSNAEEIRLRSNYNTAESAAEQTARLTKSINEQLDNPQSQLMQIINESLPETERRSTASQQKNLPSWQELMSQINGNSATSKSSGDTAKASQPSPIRKISSGTDELTRVLSDIERRYDQAKRTSNAYYNQAKRSIKNLEAEAENSVNEVQKMLKK